MKAKLFIIISLFFAFNACGYDIIDSKTGDPIKSVSNLNYSVSGSTVSLTWNLPTSFPKDVIQPVSVFIRVTKIDKDKESQEYPLYSHGIFNAGSFSLDNNPESFNYDRYDQNYTYRFTVKVMTKVNVNSVNFSNLRYSEGVVIEI